MSFTGYYITSNTSPQKLIREPIHYSDCWERKGNNHQYLLPFLSVWSLFHIATISWWKKVLFIEELQQLNSGGIVELGNHCSVTLNETMVVGKGHWWM